jgi:hypothetical protein
MAKLAKKRIGRPPGRTVPFKPVVSARVPQALYDQITSTARAARRTMAEEVFWRVQKSYADEAAQADARAILARANEVSAQIVKQKAEVVFRQAGYTYVRGINGGAWFDPGVASIQWIADSLPQDLLEELLARAAARGVELALKGKGTLAVSAEIHRREGEQP